MPYSAATGVILTPEQSLEELRTGNQRFHNGTMLRPNADAKRRIETACYGQFPKAVVLTCSDSRIPVEIVFDQGIGDLFVVRVAGNGLVEGALGSIEYGVKYLRAPLVVIMGHTGCGAINTLCSGAPIEGHMYTTLKPLLQVVENIQRNDPAARICEEAMKDHVTLDNILQGVQALPEEIPAIKSGIEQGTVRVVGCLYHTKNGTVDWLC